MIHRASASSHRAATILASIALALALTACARTVSVGLPPGVAQDEARRVENSKKLAEQAAAAAASSNPDKAIDLYMQAVREYREFPAAWTNLGLLMMEKEQYLQAAEAFNVAADLAPSDPRPLYNLGLLYDTRGYLRESRGYYERALERDDNFLPALRGAIRCDSLLNEGSVQTLRWLERALMLEQDEKWREWMRLQRARIESLPSVKVRQQF